MIQPPLKHPGLRRVGACKQLACGARGLLLLLGVVLAATACSAAPRQPLRDARHAGARPHRFVPPFAYEAFVRGELALAQGDARGAAQQLELATAAPDEDAYLLSRLAEAQAESGEQALAEQTLREAERVDGCEEHVWLTRGRWAERARDLAAAQDAYQRALVCRPDALAPTLALSRVLSEAGQRERGLALLSELAARDGRADHAAALAHALAGRSAAEVRFMLASWLSAGASAGELLQATLERALRLREPALLLSLSTQQLPRLTPSARAELARLTLDAQRMQALLAQFTESELGGPQQAAEYALWAGDFERAELYAGLALGKQPSDELRVLRARALRALGELLRALEETRALHSSERRRQLAREQLAGLGLQALAAELAADDAGGPAEGQ